MYDQRVVEGQQVKFLDGQWLFEQNKDPWLKKGKKKKKSMRKEKKRKEKKKKKKIGITAIFSLLFPFSFI